MYDQPGHLLEKGVSAADILHHMGSENTSNLHLLSEKLVSQHFHICHCRKGK